MMLDHFQRSRNAFSRITKKDFLPTTTTSFYGQKMQTRGLGIFSLELRSKTTLIPPASQTMFVQFGRRCQTWSISRSISLEVSANASTKFKSSTWIQNADSR